jgi:hypothetical protein
MLHHINFDNNRKRHLKVNKRSTNLYTHGLPVTFNLDNI